MVFNVKNEILIFGNLKPNNIICNIINGHIKMNYFYLTKNCLKGDIIINQFNGILEHLAPEILYTK